MHLQVIIQNQSRAHEFLHIFLILINLSNSAWSLQLYAVKSRGIKYLMAGFTACMVANHQKVKNSLTLKSFPFCLTVAILYGVGMQNILNKTKDQHSQSQFHSTIMTEKCIKERGLVLVKCFRKAERKVQFPLFYDPQMCPPSELLGQIIIQLRRRRRRRRRRTRRRRRRRNVIKLIKLLLEPINNR